MSIPKVIHYCWFGNGEKPECFKKCYDSWKQYAPDYEIIEWNESNTDFTASPFMQQAYAAGKYAFVSDIARLQVIFDHGGIYLDTDVELRKPLDELLEYDAFFFWDNAGNIATGLGFGAVAGTQVLKEVLASYEGVEFDVENTKKLACPVMNTVPICRYLSITPANVTQIVDRCALISNYEYAAYALHYYEFSWKSEEDKKAMKYMKKRRHFFKLRRKIRDPRIFAFFREKNLKKLGKLYEFLVYDFLDNGVVYYGYRLVRKIQKKLGG